MTIAFIVVILLVCLMNTILKDNNIASNISTTIGLAAIVITVTLLAFFSENAKNSALRYVAIGIGIIATIAILYEGFLLKNKQLDQLYTPKFNN